MGGGIECSVENTIVHIELHDFAIKLMELDCDFFMGLYGFDS